MKKNIFIVFLLGLLSCNPPFNIKPIYENFNNEAEFNIQYFNIAGYESIPHTTLLDSIIYFSENELASKNLMPPKVMIQNFYQKTLYSPCKDYENIRYEARNGEMGMLRDCDKDLLVAYIWYNKESERGHFTRIATVFTKVSNHNELKEKKIIASRYDSIKIEGNNMILLKKGKVNIE